MRSHGLVSALALMASFGVAGGGVAQAAASKATAPAVTQEALWGDVHWRLLGPFRAGWSEMVDGSALRPDTFVFAAAGGGAWRTDDAGETWTSMFDKGPTAPVGAVVMAPSNPDIIYLGSGQPTPRYDVAGGGGVFRSSDGGKTWADVGLHDTRHIGRIWVDPADPDHVVVAAVGHFFGPNPERGVFMSRDGGKTWSHALKVDDNTGAVDITADPKNPSTLFASTWQARQYPWQSYFTPIAGPGSAIWRSDDGGASWVKLGGEGWPTGPLGRVSVEAARTAAGLRLYAMVSAGDKSGLYRSDDAGGHWQRVNAEQAFTGYYSSHIAVAPNDPDTVYLVGQSIRRCDQGGAHCTIIKGAPGGDDYHFVWINPKDPTHWATASDQGTVITVNGGKTFSSWYNQPTGQFYHLATDNQFPYRVYSSQQDSGTVSLASRSDYGAPNFRDWNPVGADERDFVIPDPEDPQIVYGTGLGGRLTRWNARTGEVANIAPFLEPNYGLRQISVPHHYVWITPMAVSRTGPVTLYMGAEQVFKSTDRGQTWTTASPDLGGKTAGAKNCDGDVAVADARACGYGGIWSITPSARHAGEVWVGTDSGLVHVTRDDGAHWTDVTPPGVPAWAKIASIDVSDIEDGVAYIVIDNQRQDDFAPHAMVTRDYGKTWRDISEGLPKGQFASVIRADTVKSGLIFAGTETGVYASTDDGAHWASLKQNLPTAWVRDLTIHGDDLVAATQGRAIWVLDNIAPLREAATAVATSSAYLFTPATALRLRPNNNKDTPLPPEEPRGENPPDGALIDYWLGKPAKSVVIEIRDASGALVQKLSDAKPEQPEAEAYFSSFWLKPAQGLPKSGGMHRVSWNERWPRPEAVSFEYSIGAIPGRDTPLNPGGAYALPGDYSVTLMVDGKVVAKKPLKLVADPRTKPDRAGMEASLALSQKMAASMSVARRALGQAKAVQDQLDKLKTTDAALASDIKAASGWTAAAKALSDLSDRLGGIETDLEGGDRGPTEPQTVLADKSMKGVATSASVWSGHVHDDLAKLNAKLTKARLKPVTVPSGEDTPLLLGEGGEDLP